jgi:hypothetical protein
MTKKEKTKPRQQFILLDGSPAPDGPVMPAREDIVRPGTSRPVRAPIHGPLEYADTLAGRIARYPALAARVHTEYEVPGYYVVPTLDIVEAQRRSRAFIEARTARGVDPGHYPCLCEGELVPDHMGEHGPDSLGGYAPSYTFRRPGEMCDTCGYDGFNAFLYKRIAVMQSGGG